MRRLLALALLELLLPAVALAAQFTPPEATTIAVARFSIDAEVGPPDAVSMPHLWPRRPGSSTATVTGIYRLELPPLPTDTVHWVYVPKLRTNATFELNGLWIGDGGRTIPPLTRHANSPFHLALPPALLSPQGNILTIRVVSPATTRGGLSVVHIGPREALDGKVAMRRLVQNAGVYVTSAVIAATSLYILMIWWQIGDARRRGFLPLGMAGLVWAARNLNLVLPDFGTNSDRVQRIAEYATFAGHGIFLALFGLFFVQYYDRLFSARGMRRFRLAIIVVFALGPILLLTLGGPAPALTLWLVASVPLLVAMATVLFRQARRSRSGADALLAILFVAFIAGSVYDNTVLMFESLFGRVYIAHYVGLLFFGALAYMMVREYSQTLRDYGALTLSLETRLAERERELRLRFDDAREVERERAALLERARIMRDLHDGVGAQLLSAIHEVGESHENPQSVRDTLVACLDDLRLTVDSLEPHENYLTTILGSLRYRLAPRLASAGIAIRWDVEEVGPLEWLDPTRTLHLLRILQEALVNVLRHAAATEVLVRLTRSVDVIEVEVRDDGVGFDSETRVRGHGLRNLRQRAEHLGAQLSIRSGPGGTAIRLALPA